MKTVAYSQKSLMNLIPISSSACLRCEVYFFELTVSAKYPPIYGPMIAREDIIFLRVHVQGNHTFVSMYRRTCTSYINSHCHINLPIPILWAYSEPVPPSLSLSPPLIPHLLCSQIHVCRTYQGVGCIPFSLPKRCWACLRIYHSNCL